MPMAAIEQLLKQTMGLNSASIGSTAISRAVLQRMRERGLAEVDDYLLRLRGDPIETAKLVDLVVVPETWFFRDRNPFTALARYAREHWPGKDRSFPLRVLSLPCSSGEEPYTIVMALLDAGLTPRSFRVDAVDISEPNLERARAAVYRDNSFRGDDLSFRDRYFIKTESGYLLKADICGQVNFQQGNLLAPCFLLDAEPYDVVFCRNLLIYFDRATQAQALKVLERLLRPTGLLFLGHAEAGVLKGRHFAPLEHARSFAFVRGASQRAQQVTNEPGFRLPLRRRSSGAGKAAPPKHRPSPVGAREIAAPDPEPPKSQADLTSAAEFANAGHLVEAAKLCENHLRCHGPDAQAFHLLALVRASVGEPVEAEALFRKALYLDPGHYEALTHLAVILEQRGDQAGAALLRQRAKRSFERLRQEAAGPADSA